MKYQTGGAHQQVSRSLTMGIVLIMVAALTVLSVSPASGAVPILTEDLELKASDAAPDDKFGRAIALSEDTALVGAWTDDHVGVDAGSVYVYVRDGAGWSEQAKLTASDAAAGDHFGVEVALVGDTAVVGSFRDDDAGPDSGSVYVFVRNGTTWSEQAKLTGSDAAAGDEFGHTVRLSGETMLVGAWNDDDKGANSGSAYVYVRSGTTWSEQTKLVANDGAANDQYGISVALSGDTAAVGSWRDNAGATDSGSAYVYLRTGTTWSLQKKLVSPDPGADDRFGGRMAAEGDSIIIGAWRDDEEGTNAGAAYAFTRSGTTWGPAQKLTPADISARDAFGLAASISGDTAVITAWRDDDGAIDAGSAYVFKRSGGTWVEQSKLVASDPGAGDRYGVRVAVHGATALVGAWDHDHYSSNAGSAYFYTVSDEEPPPPPPPPPPTGRGYIAGVGASNLAGVTVQQRGATLSVRGNSSTNEVYVTEFDGDVQVAVLDGDEWIGRSYPGSVARIAIDLRESDDSLTIGDAANPGFADSITALITAELGRGDDTVRVAPDTTVAGNLLIRALADDATIDLGGLDVTGTFTTVLRNGDDAITLDGATVKRRTTLTLGPGANSVTATDTSFTGGLTVRGSNGVDAIEIVDSAVGLTTSINLSTGNDRLVLDGIGFARRASLILGSGNDDLDLTAISGSVRVIAGNGNDVVAVDQATIDDAALNLNLGGGNDSITVDVGERNGAPAARGSFIANGSGGADEIIINMLGAGLAEADVLAELRLTSFETINI